MSESDGGKAKAKTAAKATRARKKTGKRRATSIRRTSVRARPGQANAALGRRFAELLREPEAHQLGVCGKLGIPWRTHMDRMAAQPDPGTDLADYQSEILKALDEQRRIDLENAQTKIDTCHPAKAGAQFSLFRFRHENRFRRFYADENASKHEVQLTGKDGGPIESTETKVRYVVKVPQEEPEE